LEGEYLTLIKTDASGNLNWKKIFDEGGNETEGVCYIAATPDGNYIITMRGEDQSLFLLKVDGSGKKNMQPTELQPLGKPCHHWVLSWL